MGKIGKIGLIINPTKKSSLGKEICHFIIHFLILNVLAMIEDIVERFNRSFSSYIAILSKKSINGIGTNDMLRCQDALSSPISDDCCDKSRHQTFPSLSGDIRQALFRVRPSTASCHTNNNLY